MKIIKFNNLIFSVIIGFLFLLSFVSFLVNTKKQLSDHGFFVVMSESMSPEIRKGDIIITKKHSVSLYTTGDIIAFKNPSNLSETITHRIVKNDYEETFSYVTKGDNNTDSDPWKVTPDLVYGKVNLKIPYAGYVINYLKQPLFVLIIFVIPVGYILTDSIRQSVKELQLLKENLRQKKRYSNFHIENSYKANEDKSVDTILRKAAA